LGERRLLVDDLVSTEWLAGELGAPDLAIVDTTKFLDGTGRDARAEYEAGHIPGAVFLDLAELADKTPGLPHRLPPSHKFASRMQSLGIRDGQRIVVYDNSPLHSAARAWWLFRTFGAHYVAILDGGLAKWTGEGRPIETGRPQVRHGHFTPLFDDRAVVDKQIVAGLSGEELVDARPAARFRGEEEDPRAGMASGHIPGSRNLPQRVRTRTRPRRPARRERRGGRHKARSGWTPSGMDARHRQSAGLARVHNLVRQRRADACGLPARRRAVALRPKRNADAMGAGRCADPA
jgi:thiosulfate/3-mercaptopyruvate sulfurtransferase